MERATTHPIRLVIADDLRRSRLTVFFRLLLALPHLVWLALLTVAALIAVFVGWWAALFAGRLPGALHRFLAGYVRYGTHVWAFVLLAANPFPPFYPGSARGYPIDVQIDPPAPQRRLVTLFRFFLAYPALLVSGVLRGGFGGTAGVGDTSAFLMWFAALARARAPRGLRDLTAWAIGYSAQLAGYLFLLTDRYPTSDPLVQVGAAGEVAEPEPDQPARGVVRDDLRRSRLTVFFRLLLWIPHAIWWRLWSIVAVIVAVLNWFAALALGRTPRPFARFLSAYVRYSMHQQAFLTLIGNPFPGFVGKAGSYPIDLELDPFQRQRRLTIFFRLLLAVPALLLSGVASGVLFVAAVLGWFASLARGRMPEGLRNAGAWALAYSGQTSAYVFLLSDRYPYSHPTAVTWGG